MKWFTLFWICVMIQLIKGQQNTGGQQQPSQQPNQQQPGGFYPNNPATNIPQNQGNQQPINPNTPTSNFPQNQGSQQPINTNNPGTNYPQGQGNQQPLYPNYPGTNLPQNQGIQQPQQNPNGAYLPGSNGSWNNQTINSTPLEKPKRPIRCPLSMINYPEFTTGITRIMEGIDRLRDSRQPKINQMNDYFKKGSNTMFVETMRRYQRKSVRLTDQQRIESAPIVERTIERYKTIRDQYIKDLDALVKGSGSEQSLMNVKDRLETAKVKLATTKTDLIVFPQIICDGFNTKYAPFQNLVDEILLKAKSAV